jgi:hypothetical protein
MEEIFLKGFEILTTGCYPLICMEEKQFLKHCRTDTYAASGPGGQKRNRTYSAVRLTHVRTGISVIAEESRSQLENRIRAAKRLKKTIALSLRMDPSISELKIHEDIKVFFTRGTAVHINQKNVLYPVFCATILDALLLAGGSMRDAAKILNISTGQINKLLGRDRDLLNASNYLRDYFHLKPLKKQ